MLDYYDFIYIFHILIIGPLLIYVGYYKEKVDKRLLDILLWFGVIVTIYHLYKLIINMMVKSKYKTI